ncbi:hypothetical protein BDZ89DRAFT_1048851 [Hymenopellis radicata]|nr:hypothetical protein BDZ89DRAFT_1048851 [Hymenopellis radicata]
MQQLVLSVSGAQAYLPRVAVFILNLKFPLLTQLRWRQTPTPPVASVTPTPAPYGTRGEFPFKYVGDMIEFCDLFVVNKPKYASRALAFQNTASTLLRPNVRKPNQNTPLYEAHPKYNKSTVNDHVRHLTSARELAEQLAPLGRVPAAEWSIVREYALALKNKERGAQ